jgi:uncharacterized protein (DUF433 family)
MFLDGGSTMPVHLPSPMSARTRRAVQPPELRDQPAYPLAEAARYLKLPPATLRSWVAGRVYPKAKGVAQFEPLISPASNPPPILSFWNLIEAHVLRSLRTKHGVSIGALRDALAFAERKLGIGRLLLRKELRTTDAGKVFLERYGELIELSASGQLAMREYLEEHLKRVEWDESQFPIRLYPFVGIDYAAEKRPIAIDPRIAFGRPMLVSKGVSTAVIADRIDANESIRDVARDYGLTEPEIAQAVFFERAA